MLKKAYNTQSKLWPVPCPYENIRHKHHIPRARIRPACGAFIREDVELVVLKTLHNKYMEVHEWRLRRQRYERGNQSESPHNLYIFKCA